jgi:hypothetical protein
MLDDIQMLSVIGEGEFGKVFLVSKNEEPRDEMDFCNTLTPH